MLRLIVVLALLAFAGYSLAAEDLPPPYDGSGGGGELPAPFERRLSSAELAIRELREEVRLLKAQRDTAVLPAPQSAPAFVPPVQWVTTWTSPVAAVRTYSPPVRLVQQQAAFGRIVRARTGVCSGGNCQ